MSLRIPKGAEPYILFQRTAYLRLTKSAHKGAAIFCTILRRFLSYNRYVALEARLFPKRIQTLFGEDMQREYESLRDCLPKRVANVLDIGCGVAGIDVFLYRHYPDGLAISLLDKTVVDEKVFYLFEKKGSFYNSLAVATDLLVLNGVPAEKIHTEEATEDTRIPFDEHFDLIISLISWGFHYPVATYLDAAYDKLNSGGTLIIDVRNGTDGEALLEKRFGSFTVILDEQKYRRIKAVKA